MTGEKATPEPSGWLSFWRILGRILALPVVAGLVIIVVLRSGIARGLWAGKVYTGFFEEVLLLTAISVFTSALFLKLISRRKWPHFWRILVFVLLMLFLRLVSQEGLLPVIGQLGISIASILWAVLWLLKPFGSPLKSLIIDFYRHQRGHFLVHRGLRGLQEGALQQAIDSIDGFLKLQSIIEPVLTGLQGFAEKERQEVANSIEGFLKARTVVDPICKSVSRVPKPRREEFGSSILSISTAWAELFERVAKATDQSEGRLLSAFLRKYADEEQLDVSGKSHSYPNRHVIVTNFVAYAHLVEAVIVEAGRCFGSREVVCRTALVLPLTRWFNFKRRAQLDGNAVGSAKGRLLADSPGPARHSMPPFCEVHEGWLNYIRFQHRLTHGIEVPVQRILLAMDHQPGDEGEKKARAFIEANGLGFHTRACIERHARSFILVPKQSSTQSFIEPLKASVLRRLLDQASPEFKELAGHYRFEDFDPEDNAKEPKAYLIVAPPDQRAPTWVPEGKAWWQVGELFMQWFHQSPLETHCRFHALTESQLNEYFLLPSAQQRMPEDIFLVGRASKAGANWIFGLAADVDPEMDRLTLEFMTPTLCRDRFHEICEYLEIIQGASEALRKILTD